MAAERIQLAQARENSTNAVSVYGTDNGHLSTLQTIMLCNTTASAVTFRLFFDEDGTTYDETTALYWDASLAAGSTLTIELLNGLYMANDAGNIAYRSSVANAITITIWGTREFRNR